MTAFEDLCRAEAPVTRTLLELTVFQLGTPSGDGVIPLNSLALNSLPDGEEFTPSEEVRRFGDHAHVTLPTDDPANTLYAFAELQPPAITRELPLGPLGSRRLTFTVGELSLAGNAAALDSDMASAGIDGRDIVIRLGGPDWPLADFGTIFAGAGNVWWRDRERVRIMLRDNIYKLARVLQTAFYGGTGGYDGGSDLSGLPRPLCFGQRRNLPAVLVDQAAQIYQVHTREINAVLGVFEGAAPITDSTDDYADYSSLAGASVASGEYATCLAYGLFRLGAAPSGQVTADIQGDAVGGYVDTAAEIAQRLLEDFGGVQTAEIDTAALTAFAAAEAGAIGLWIGAEAIDVDAAMDRIAASVLAWWGCKRDGLYTMGALRGPLPGETDFSFTEGVHILHITPLQPSEEAWPPPWRIGVGYDPVETVQSGDGLSGSASTARRQLVSQAYRYALAADAGIPGRYRQAQNWSELPAAFSDSTAAQAKAAALLAAYGSGQRLYDAKIPARLAYLLDLGQGGTITAPSLGITAKAARIVGIIENPAQNEARLTLWVAP